MNVALLFCMQCSIYHCSDIINIMRTLTLPVFYTNKATCSSRWYISERGIRFSNSKFTRDTWFNSLETQTCWFGFAVLPLAFFRSNIYSHPQYLHLLSILFMFPYLTPFDQTHFKYSEIRGHLHLRVTQIGTTRLVLWSYHWNWFQKCKLVHSTRRFTESSQFPFDVRFEHREYTIADCCTILPRIDFDVLNLHTRHDDAKHNDAGGSTWKGKGKKMEGEWREMACC